MDKHWHWYREVHGSIYMEGESIHKAGEWLTKLGIHPWISLVGLRIGIYLNNKIKFRFRLSHFVDILQHVDDFSFPVIDVL